MVASKFIEGLAGTAQMKRVAAGNPRTRHFAQFAKVDGQWRSIATRKRVILAFMNSRSKCRQFTSACIALRGRVQSDGGLRAGFKL